MMPIRVYAGAAYCPSPGCETRFGPVVDGIIRLPRGWWQEAAGWVRIPGTRKQTRRAVPDSSDARDFTPPTWIVCPKCRRPSGPALIQHGAT